jgi:hypothetical protein
MPLSASRTMRQATGTLQPAKRFDQAPTGAPTIGERLTARWKGHEYKGAFIDATVTAVDPERQTCAVDFRDGFGDVDVVVTEVEERHSNLMIAKVGFVN